MFARTARGEGDIVSVTDRLPWRRWWARADRTLREGARIAHTARGDVQYSDTGSGIPLIALHGTPGGYDQGAALAALFGADSGIRVIAPSRPGYLGTDAALGLTPREQGDLVIALLDTLGLDTAFVCGISGGGMAALWCAADHAERVSGLILLEALIEAQDIRLSPFERAVLSSDVIGWGVDRVIVPVVRCFSRHRDFAAGGSAAAAAMSRSGFPFPPRARGTEADEIAASDFVAPEPTRMAVPTLIVHGDRDRTVPVGPAIQAALTLPNARLALVTRGSHHSTVPSETARASMHAFLVGNAGH